MAGTDSSPESATDVAAPLDGIAGRPVDDGSVVEDAVEDEVVDAVEDTAIDAAEDNGVVDVGPDSVALGTSFWLKDGVTSKKPGLDKSGSDATNPP